MKMIDSIKIKNEFPIFQRKINDNPLIYFDNAATSQMPQFVIDKIIDFEVNHRANVHRGVHTLSEEASEMFENARKTVANFIKAVVPEEVVFTNGTTDSINLVAEAWGRKNLNKGDIILISDLEHHSNLLPWQKIAKENGCEIAYIPSDKNGELNFKAIDTDWSKVKLVALTHVSNVLGVVNDIKSISKYIKRRVIESKGLTNGELNNKSEFPKILLDAAQSVPHFDINVQKLGIDFMVFSGHKMCGPMGIGGLWINRDAFNELGVFKVGGGMIREVFYEEEAVYANPPEKFEAGTPNVSGAIGLAAACEYLENIGMDKIAAHEMDLTTYALEKLQNESDIEICGSIDPSQKSGVIAFNMKDVPSHDVATILNSDGIAVRSGHHCVMPWHMKQKTTTTVRASFYLYNNKEEIDAMIESFKRVRKILKS